MNSRSRTQEKCGVRGTIPRSLGLTGRVHGDVSVQIAPPVRLDRHLASALLQEIRVDFRDADSDLTGALGDHAAPRVHNLDNNRSNHTKMRKSVKLFGDFTQPSWTHHAPPERGALLVVLPDLSGGDHVALVLDRAAAQERLKRPGSSCAKCSPHLTRLQTSDLCEVRHQPPNEPCRSGL